ncbi:MAG: response regulator [Thermoproteota archaeon]|nr:response regulator [Thermoproteota archaeon]
MNKSILSIQMEKRILVVDDEPDINSLFKMILEENSEFMVHSFTDPLLALRNFKPNFYDLILVDIKMPEMDGLDFYREIRKIDKKVRLCFVTASEKYYEPFRKEIYDILGENCFIQKPIANEDLLKVVNTMIKG